jgi:eukaryotic-like serine/threonine-protein kinase
LLKMEAHVGDEFILSELCDGSLVDFMQKFPNCKLSEQLIVDIMKQVCLGVGYLHEKLICHRDLKVENILFKGERMIIADFGSCTRESTIDYKQASKV